MKDISFKNSDNFKDLEGFTKLILAFNKKKYSLFREIANRERWDQIYVNDIRYDLIRMAIMEFHISKGFFTISDITDITDLNVRSIERFLKKLVVAGYFEKRSSKNDKRVVEYFATDKSLLMLKIYLNLLKEGAGLFNVSSEETANLGNIPAEDLKKYLDWSKEIK
tara:strand:+ start:955 stop:1452 length:498 start_codon:yes stop_codon:yes gene_type:complete